MGAENWITVSATVCAFAWMLRAGAVGRFLYAQGIAAFLAVYLTACYYSPLCSQRAYEWLALVGNVCTMAVDLWAIAGLIGATGCLLRASAGQWAVVLLWMLHQRVVLDWMWQADMFRDATDAGILWMRFGTNLAYLLAVCLMYSEGTSPRVLKHSNERKG